MPSVQEFYGVGPDHGGPPTDPPAATTAPTHPKGPTENASRFAVLNALVDHSLADIKGRNDLAVWFILWKATNAQSGTATVSQEYIAERAGCHVNTVKNALNRLKRRGLVSVPKQGGFRAGASSYRVHGVAADRGKGQPPETTP